MGKNRGKDFEDQIREAFKKVPGVSIDRIPDQTMHHKGACNICDFIAYKKPYEYYIECKSVHGNTLSIHSNPKPDKKGVLHGFYGNITDTQWEGLLEKSVIPGVIAGVMCWWVDKDVTLFIPIKLLKELRDAGAKSIRYDITYDRSVLIVELKGQKKRVFFDYDLEEFLTTIEGGYKDV